MWDNFIGSCYSYKMWDDFIVVRNVFFGLEGGKIRVFMYFFYNEWDCIVLF